MRIAVCDDEEQYRIQLKALLEKIGGILDTEIDTFSNGEWLLDAFRKNSYDIIFLDIEMPEMDGITLARKIREISDKANIVFLTGHVEYALEGYEVNALRYLTKPVQTDKLKEVMRFVGEKNRNKKQLIIKEDGEEILLDIDEIIYMEAQNQNVLIHTKKKNHLIRYNLGEYEEELKKDGFFRIHRGYLIPLSKVKKLVKNDVILEGRGGDITLPVSRNALKSLKEALYAFVESEAF